MLPKYYDTETEKALKNFPFSGSRVKFELVYAITEIKQAAAITHKKIGHFSPEIADAIAQAAIEIRTGMFNHQFILPALQGGAGTSINMNVNEVIAARSQEILVEKNRPHCVHPNDHVNKSQSTNDVNPSALKIACIRLCMHLFTSINDFVQSCEELAEGSTGVLKLGRTHLQDAVPITVSEQFFAYADTMRRDKKRLEEILPYFYELNLGGTAVGNSINATIEYRRHVYEELRSITHLPLKPADNFMSQTNSQSDFVMLSHALVCLTLDLSKIANDLRLLSSGPHGGIGELSVEELQSGSSIMPGKVNPILPETVNQLYFMVSGNNISIEHAAHAAQLELGVMFPIIADRLLSSVKLTSEVLDQFAHHCIKTLRINEELCHSNLEHSTAYATLLTPLLGYDTVSTVVKEAIKTGTTLRQVILEKGLLTEDKFNQITYIKCPNIKKGDRKNQD